MPSFDYSWLAPPELGAWLLGGGAAALVVLFISVVLVAFFDGE